MEVREIDPVKGYIEFEDQQFPHIQEKLEVLWGEPECYAYLKTLTVSDRDDRMGFPQAVFRSLVELLVLHPAVETERSDLWTFRA